MELCSFWAINPADGQTGKPEPVKLTFFENGDVQVVSLCEDSEYWGAYKLPSGSYRYTGDALIVEEDDLKKIQPLIARCQDSAEYRSELLSAGLIQDREWGLFYASPPAWKSLRVIVVAFGNE